LHREDLMKQFGIDLDFSRSIMQYRNKQKEEMVHGFTGDQEDWYAFSTCLFHIVNFFFYEVLVEFLRQRVAWFDWMRTDIIKNGKKILLCSVFDIALTVMPMVYVISDYKNGLKYLFY